MPDIFNPFAPLSPSPATPAPMAEAPVAAPAPGTQPGSVDTPSRDRRARVRNSGPPASQTVIPQAGLQPDAGMATVPPPVTPTAPNIFDPFAPEPNAGGSIPYFDPFQPAGQANSPGGVVNSRLARPRRSRGNTPTDLAAPPPAGQNYVGAQITPKSNLDREAAAREVAKVFYDMFIATDTKPNMRDVSVVYGIANNLIKKRWKEFASGALFAA